MSIQPATGLKRMACVCALATFTVGGCASGPIDMVRAPSLEATTIAQEQALRDSARMLAVRVEENGWSLAPPAGQAARSFLGRLIGGEGEAAAREDAVLAYLEDNSDTAMQRRDVIWLTEAAERVANAARAVAGAAPELDEAALTADIAAAEDALGAVRRARAFFAEVHAVQIEQAGDLSAGSGAVGLAASLEALRAAEADLAAAADALAERRWAGHGDALSG